jgi:N-acyl-D-amino-acid deacylase
VTADELAAMERLLAEALAAGAWGLSSGLFTAPGCYADAAEIHALARLLRRHGGAYASHIRDEANYVDAAVAEAIAVAEATGVHVQIAHLKLSGVDNWGGAARLLETIAAARRRGLPVDCDAYPYDTATNPLRNLLPRFVMEGGIPAMLERLGRREVRERLRAEIAREGLTNFGRIPSWDVVRVAVSPHLPQEAGRTFGELARRHRVDPLDAVCDFIVADRGETRILITSMSDDDVRRIAGAPWVTIGSDGNALATSGVTGQGKPHPRYYGTHARMLGSYVRDLGLLTLPAAIHKMAGASAAALGLRDRGVLRENAWADVTVFDPARVAERGTYDDPHQYAVGVSTVVVNGEVVIDGGDHTGALPGRVLRRSTTA